MGQRKTVVITGSTKGIGKAIAFHLAKQDYNIVLNYASDERQAQEILALCQQVTPRVLLVKADVSNKHAVGALMQASIQEFGSLNVLINNAARAIDKPVLEMSENDWDQVIATNMKGTFLCSQMAASYMLRQEDGGIILNIGASTGIRGRKNGINTCASKAGIMIMTQCLALELGPKIRVNTIIPGLTKTEETTKRFHLDDPAIVQARTESIPLQRIGTPQDIAHAVSMLLSDEAGFITGQKLVVDGGQYMW
jgi:NAD(P)-dependent dehydrogenase (short-subunit alcohol dehydrogenase family)